MFYYLHYLKDSFSFLEVLNVFQYQTFRSVGACLTSFLIMMLLGKRIINKLSLLKAKQFFRDKEEVKKLYDLHEVKAGTPTMGGILILAGVIVSTFLWTKLENPFIQVLIFVCISTGALGFVDDYFKIKGKNSKGLKSLYKLLFQILISLLVVAFLYFHSDTGEYIRQFYVPSIKEPLIKDMGLFTFIFLPLVLVASSNAVNLTDGLDGLASGCTVITVMTYAILTYLAGHQIIAKEYLFIPYNQHSGEVSIFCSALIGATLGFLWFNSHPAEVFMGDTGSLSIGFLIGTISICCKQELLLLLVGFIFFIETLSVIIQVISFKTTGKRVFKMSPLHHHFELIGWSENKVITRFWIVAIIMAIVGLMTLKLR